MGFATGSTDVSRRARHAARHASVRARDRPSGLAFDLAALGPSRTLGARQRAARTRFTDHAAVVIEAGEGAFATGSAGAAAVGALADAARIVAFAADVARRCRAREGARAAGAATTVSVGASAAAGGAVTVDVTRRAAAAKAAAAVVPARAIAVGAGARAVVVVAFADDRAGRRLAVEVARIARVAHAAPARTVVVVVAAGSEGRGDTQKNREQRDANARSIEHDRERCTDGRPRNSDQRKADPSSSRATRGPARSPGHSEAPRSTLFLHRSCSLPGRARRRPRRRRTRRPCRDRPRADRRSRKPRAGSP